MQRLPNTSLNVSYFSSKAMTQAQEASFLDSVGDIADQETRLLKAIPSLSYDVSNPTVHRLITDAFARQSLIVSRQQERVNELAQRAQQYEISIEGLRNLQEAYLAAGDTVGVNGTDHSIRVSHIALSNTRQKLNFAQEELERVQRGENPHPLAEHNGVRPE